METQSDKILEWFNKFAKEHKDDPITQSWCYNGGAPVKENMFNTWVPYVQKYFHIEKEHFLLDVGCGSGLFLERFRKYTPNLYGVDPAEEVIKSAQERCPDIKFRVGDVWNAGFDEIKFDRIFCSGVLFYLNSFDECKKALEHFFEISKSDARIWLGDIPMPNPELNDKNFKRIERSTGWKLQHYPPQFFYDICDPLGYNARVFYQEVEDKMSTSYKYDILIEKNKQ